MKNIDIRHLSSALYLIAAMTLGLLVYLLLTKVLYLADYTANYARYAQVDTTIVSASSVNREDYQQGRILSSFYGLDDALPAMADLFICDGAGGKDGIPVVFSHQIDITTLDPGDFQIINEKSELKPVHCLSLVPAIETGEQRTVLLVGDFGNIDEQPVSIEIVGNIISIGGKTNFKGAIAPIVPLEQGPSIVFAEMIPRSAWRNDKSDLLSFWKNDADCPPETQQMLRVTWNGGISKASNLWSYETIRQQYTVRLLNANRSQTSDANPIALIDVSDGDNNHVLCLDTADPVVSIDFPAGHLVDPRGDINPQRDIVKSGVQRFH